MQRQLIRNLFPTVQVGHFTSAGHHDIFHAQRLIQIYRLLQPSGTNASIWLWSNTADAKIIHPAFALLWHIPVSIRNMARKTQPLRNPSLATALTVAGKSLASSSRTDRVQAPMGCVLAIAIADNDIFKSMEPP